MPNNPLDILIKDPTGTIRIWWKPQVYMGPNAALPNGNIVVKANDLVYDRSEGFFWVQSVDDQPGPNGEPASNTPFLVPYNLIEISTRNIDGGLYQSVNTYQPSAQELAFFDNTIEPYTISIDGRWLISGTDAYMLKLFKGLDLTNNGTVISQVYNGAGDFVSENVELELIDPNNPALKKPRIFHTMHQLLDNERVTAVVYSQTGAVVEIRYFLVKNTSAIRAAEAFSNYIVDVKLISNMISTDDTTLINVPINIPVSGGDFQAELIYSNGHKVRIAIDGVRCRILGIESFNTSVPGNKGSVVLTYYPDVNEPVINASNPLIKNVSKIYNIQAVTSDHNTAFKVYVCPYYDKTTDKYVNRYYIINLGYDYVVELDNNSLTVQAHSGVIDYSSSANNQIITLIVDVGKLLPLLYTGYRHVQQVSINYGSAANNQVPWVIDYLNNGERRFGLQARFEYSELGMYALSFQSGAITPEQWLERLWYPIHCAYNEKEHLYPPKPTHFKYKYLTYESEPKEILAEWNMLVNNPFNTQWFNQATIEVVWLIYSPSFGDYLTLGISPVMIQNTLV